MQVQSVIALIPAYNEANRIAPVIKSSTPHVNQVVVIDDGSTDNTASVAQSSGATVIRHPLNKGKGAAIQTALDHLQHSQADPAIFLDADGQHDPDEIPLFIDAARKHQAGIVVGNRLHNPIGMPLIRLLTNRFTSSITGALARHPVPASQDAATGSSTAASSPTSISKANDSKPRPRPSSKPAAPAKKDGK